MDDYEIVRECPACDYVCDASDREIKAISATWCKNDDCRVDQFVAMVRKQTLADVYVDEFTKSERAEELIREGLDKRGVADVEIPRDQVGDNDD
jgi:hypothetical protein